MEPLARENSCEATKQDSHKFQKIQITLNMFSDHNGMKVEICKRK